MQKTFVVTVLLACFMASPSLEKSCGDEFEGDLEDDFYLSVLVDFIDDALEIHYTPEKIQQMMEIFKQVGVKRVYWQHYGGSRANLRFWSGYASTQASRDTIQSLGGMPINVAVEKARKVGLDSIVK